MSDSSISSDESDWDGSWGCPGDFSDVSGLNQDHSYPYIFPSSWYSPGDQEKKEPIYQSELYPNDISTGFLNSVKTVPGNVLESEEEEVSRNYLDNSEFNQGVSFFDFQIPSCRSQNLQYNAKLCIEYIEEDISRIMCDLEQQFQECVMTKDSKRQRNHGFSIEEVTEIDSVEQKKYRLRSYISILRYITMMIENCASIELQAAKEELEMTNLLRSNISEAFMRLQKVNLSGESLNDDIGKSKDSQKASNSKIRKSKRIQAKVLEEEVTAVQSSSPKPEINDFHSISDESSKFCFCRQPVLDNMIRCESGDQCIYGEWFHFLCLKIINEPQKTWYCPGCSKNEEYRALWSHILQRETLRKSIETTIMNQQDDAEVSKTPVLAHPKNEKRKNNSKKERRRSKSVDGCPKKKQSRGSFFDQAPTLSENANADSCEETQKED
ncbi:Ing1 like PHD finger protein [Cryptosporidium canis]|uniref:Ing1 like PHD finger protein n=1 Tax=Cryptosporidium canis TaxID=195482 RepID=A0A9D5DJM9_9CRYT|nr:Ing1 like PHD finger protein [Cryptosporidium canis]